MGHRIENRFSPPNIHIRKEKPPILRHLTPQETHLAPPFFLLHLNPYLQIRHPKIVQLRQVERVRGLVYEIDNSLVRWKIALASLRQRCCSSDDDLRINLHFLAKLLFSKPSAVLLGEPKYHLVSHKHAEVLLQLKLGIEVRIRYFISECQKNDIPQAL